MAKPQNLTGKTFGRLIVLSKDIEASKQHKRAYWLCQCSCGNKKTIAGLSLIRGATQSCGCLRNEKVFNARAKMEEGKQYGKLTVLKMDTERDKYGRIKWICKCDCGNIKSISGADLRSGNTSSCGCKNGISKGEQKILEILENNKISYIREYKIPKLNNKRFDFVLLNDDNQIYRIIEFDGEQHFKETKWKREKLIRTQQSDKEKNEYALSHNIPLVRIPYWELNNISLELLLSNKFLIKKED